LKQPPQEKQALETPNLPRSPFRQAISSVITVGRELLARQRVANLPGDSAQSLKKLCSALIDHRGEASGLALAEKVAGAYQHLDANQKLLFLQSLATDFDVDPVRVLNATDKYRETPSQENLEVISHAIEAPRKKLFRRINMAPDGTRMLVKLRGDLLELLGDHPELHAVDSDLKHLFVYWFNKGFLQLRQIDWSSPGYLLEKLIEYEAVHEINGWDDLRGRLRDDRRCFAFFHPAMDDDPVVFVEVALTDAVPGSIAPLISLEREAVNRKRFNTVVFYSISNCHPGLAGISFGNFLIKNVVKILAEEISSLKTFVTLSPIPGFRRWLAQADLAGLVDEALIDKVRQPIGQVVETEVRDALMHLCAHYLVKVRRDNLAYDPVARFHLGNGARLYRLHWGADLTSNGKKQSAGIMVNYLYEIAKIEINHEEYFGQGKISASKDILKLLE